MMRLSTSLLALALGCLTAVAVGCGDRSGLIPVQSADALKANLAALQTAVDGRDCAQTAVALARARAAVDNLPPAVDDRLRQRLTSGLTTLATQADKECALPAKTTTQEVPTTTTTDTPTTTSDTTTTTTSTTDTTTTTTTSTPPGQTTSTDNGGGASPTPTTGTTTTTTPTTTTPAGGGIGSGR